MKYVYYVKLRSKLRTPLSPFKDYITINAHKVLERGSANSQLKTSPINKIKHNEVNSFYYKKFILKIYMTGKVFFYYILHVNIVQSPALRLLLFFCNLVSQYNFKHTNDIIKYAGIPRTVLKHIKTIKR